MNIVPVLDLMAGRVVRGIGGRRGDYRPIISQLTASNEPATVAAAFASHFGLTELYLADLDAIAGAPPAFDIYARLHADGFRLWVDAGVRTVEQVHEIARAGVKRVVIGLETVAGPDVLVAAVAALGEGVVFSLDLRDGQPLGNVAAWPDPNAEAIAAHAIATGIRELIVLDLARVGVGSGPEMGGLCARLARTYSHVAVYAGGGVRGPDDLRQLQGEGMRGALVASALHDGKLSRHDLEALARP
jgi:phosphoribosylformimino-5-aminoimidazole carboxamide ribotide isomerase